MSIFKSGNEFRKSLQELSREDLLEVIRMQDPELIKQINRIEWVFENKLQHLTWNDGNPVLQRPLTKEELALLIDEPFELDSELLSMGISSEQQRQLHIAKDSVTWARNFLDVNPRVYQILILRHPSLRKVLRAGRRLGKSFSMAIQLLHYSYTHKDGRCLVIAPMKSHVELIYQEVLRLASKSEVVMNSISRKVTSPQFLIQFTNGSTIRFFTSGMRSGGKADVARGQEAHVIVLDEMDYMHADDLDALYAMLQKTAEDQPDKIMIGASTPTGRRERFWEWCNSPRFKEFWFPSYCFDPSTLITMADGSFKTINNININDLVLTENGPQKVTRVFEREFTGSILNIKTYGDNSDLLVTKEHPFAVVDRVRRQKKFDWEWKEAGELKLGSIRNNNSGTYIRSIVDTQVVNQNIDLLSIFDKDLVEHDDGKVKLKKFSNNGRKFINSLPRYLNFDKDLAVLLGWYLAEGHVESKDKFGRYKTIGWTLNSNELSAIQEIETALLALNAGAINKTYRKDNQSVCIRVANAPLALLCEYLCGSGSSTKELHSLVMQGPVDFQKELLGSYGNGDGYHTKRQTIIFRTSSRILAKQIQVLCARVNSKIPSISKSEQRNRCINKKYKQYMTVPTYAIEWNLNESSNLIGKTILNKNDFALLLKSKNEFFYSGKVYNFEVEETNSYIANGLLVHNCNPFFSKEQEEEFREQYASSAYRHEIEADWGEDSEGVYPRKFIDKAFISPEWSYIPELTSARSFHIIGVDWDKYGAGTNIVVLEVCNDNYEDERFRGKVRVYYREEINKSEYTLTKAVDRIIELNQLLNPKHIYVDRGFGEVQVELLRKHGVEFPQSKLKERVKGISFAESIEVRDPYTKLMIKKEIKPYMVDNLTQFLEKENIVFSAHDEELYMQLISYVVVRTTSSGRPVFEAGGSAVDHAHDALILALLAVTENYGEFSKSNYATNTEFFSNEFMTNNVKDSDSEGEKYRLSGRVQALSPNQSHRRKNTGTRIARKMF